MFTGDTHGTYNIIKRLNNVIDLKKENEHVSFFIAGDVGIGFYIYEENIKNIDILQEKLKNNNITLYFINGNHDNIPYLKSLYKNDKDMSIIRDNIFYLNTSNIYNIENKNIFCYGGAFSVDRSFRTIGIDYWEEEIPNYLYLEKSIENIRKNPNNIDIVLTHQGPLTIIDEMFNYTEYFIDSVSKDLEIIKKEIENNNTDKNISWIFGHHHKYKYLKENNIDYYCLDNTDSILPWRY